MKCGEFVYLRNPLQLLLDHLSPETLQVVLYVLEATLQLEELPETCQDASDPCHHVGNYVDNLGEKARLAPTPRPAHPHPW